MTSFGQNIHLYLNLFNLFDLNEILNRSGFLKHHHNSLIKGSNQVQEVMFLLLILKIELIFLAGDDDFDSMVDMEVYLLCDVFQGLVFLAVFVEVVVAFLLAETEVDKAFV